MRATLAYTTARILLFVAATGLIYLAGARGLLLLGLALVVSGAASYILLSRQRDAMAGALGRPTFVALMHVPEWRWLLHRIDSPWYPATRLFRQSHAGDWRDVFARIADAVRALAQARGG